MIARRQRRFWIVSAAALLAILTSFALGRWQMSRASQKLALQAEIEQRKAMPAITARELLGRPAPEILYRPVQLRGAWVGQHTVFLDNRQMRGTPGFYVVTPLKLDEGPAVLVTRGWVQRNFLQREQLPSITTPAGLVEVRGRIAPAPAKLYEFDGAAAGPIRQNLDLARFRAETGLALLEVQVEQTEGPVDGLLRDWPELASGVEKHYGYAFQWWALSALIAVLYAWFQYIAPKRKRQHAG